MSHPTTSLLRAACLAACLLIAPAYSAAGGDGGNVMPPRSHPHGYTLDAMTSALALFNTSGNDPAYYPATPFQILYVKEWTAFEATTCINGQGGYFFAGIGDFLVNPGTPFFVPVWNADDSPPFIAPFPTDKSGAGDYFFGSNANGATGMKITLDGNVTNLGPQYLGGPVTTPPLPDGGGTHLIMLGGFITPLSVGTHTVHIQGELGNTQAFFDTYGVWCYRADLSYTVQVHPVLDD